MFWLSSWNIQCSNTFILFTQTYLIVGSLRVDLTVIFLSGALDMIVLWYYYINIYKIKMADDEDSM